MGLQRVRRDWVTFTCTVPLLVQAPQPSYLIYWYSSYLFPYFLSCSSTVSYEHRSQNYQFINVSLIMSFLYSVDISCFPAHSQWSQLHHNSLQALHGLDSHLSFLASSPTLPTTLLSLLQSLSLLVILLVSQAYSYHRSLSTFGYSAQDDLAPNTSLTCSLSSFRSLLRYQWGLPWLPFVTHTFSSFLKLCCASSFSVACITI